MGEYNLLHFGDMLADKGRVGAYLQALESAIKPGSIVLDLGTGPGFFALKACDYGAARVYAVDANPSIELARELARVNGRLDQIEFLQAFSTEIDLPEQVDVIVSDLRGVTPLYQGHIESISDARRRFLRPGGTLIPLRDELWCAPVGPSALGEPYTVWSDDFHGIDLAAGAKYVRNITSAPSIGADDLIAEPRLWSTLEYGTISDTSTSGTATWDAPAGVIATGLCIWFEAILSEDADFTSGPSRPGGPERIAETYRRAYYPFLEDIRADDGDRLTVDIEARSVEGLSGGYGWRWTTTLFDESGEAKQRFDQTTLLSMPIPRPGGP